MKNKSDNCTNLTNKSISCLLVVVALYAMAFIWNAKKASVVLPLQQVQNTSFSTKPSMPFVDNYAVTKAAKIKDIDIGERVIGTNPEISHDERREFGPEPTNKSHLGFYLVAKHDESVCFVHLLRPHNWLTENVKDIQDIRVNDAKQVQILLAMPEMGIVGWTTLVGTHEIDAIKPGNGNIVTGTFCHLANETLGLEVEDIEPIACTSNHPFWSNDRKEFVEAGQLFEGESVILYNGQTKRVINKLARPGPKLVYNLEVFGEHVYHVTQNGVLVHNTCVYINPTADDGIDYVGITNNFARRAAEHLRNNPLRQIIELEIGEQITRKKARALEQVLIDRYRAKLDNKINSIAPHRQDTDYASEMEWARKKADELGFFGLDQ